MAQELRTKIPRTRQESIKLLGELIEDFRVAMLTSMGENGALRSRPMVTDKPFENGVHEVIALSPTNQ